MLCNVVLVSAVQQSESTVCPHAFPLFRFPPHLGSRRVELPVLYGRSRRVELPVLYRRFAFLYTY